MSNKTRRRGEELKIALYEATFKVIQTDGIHAVTFGKIAKEAKTSSSVLYRYWENPFDLMFDTIKYFLNKEELSQKVLIFNQGSLREDLLYVASFFINGITKGVPNYFHLLFQIALDEGDQKKVRKLLAEAEQANLKLIEQALQNAIERKEIKKMPPVFTQVAMFEQIRYRTMIMGQLPTQSYITMLVDQLILPAIQFQTV